MLNGGAGIKDGTFITNMRTKARTLLPMRGGCLDVSGSTPRVVPMPREALVFSDEVMLVDCPDNKAKTRADVRAPTASDADQFSALAGRAGQRYKKAREGHRARP